MAETVRSHAVAVAPFVGVGDVGGAPIRHVDEGLGGRTGQRGLFLTEHTDEHDESLGAGGSLFQLIAAADAAARAAEEGERLERLGHRVAVRLAGRGEVIAAAVAEHGGLGRAGEQRRGVLGDEAAVVDGNGAAARKLSAVGHVHDRAGGKGNGQLTGERDDLQARDAGENVVLLDARFGKDGGVVGADSGLRRRDRGVPTGLGVVERAGIRLGNGLVDPFLRLSAERAVQKVQRDERIARVAARGDGVADKHERGQDESEKEGAFFHFGSFTPGEKCLVMR